MDTLSLARFDRTLALAGGARVRLRPIRSDDEPRLSELYDRSSRNTRYQRFFTVMRRLPPDWAHFLANVDYDRRFALVAEDLSAPRTTLIGVARYEPAGEGLAEIAFVVEDAWQGKGLGTLLITELFRAAAVGAHDDHAGGARPRRPHDPVGGHTLRQDSARAYPRAPRLRHQRVEPALRGSALGA